MRVLLPVMNDANFQDKSMRALLLLLCDAYLLPRTLVPCASAPAAAPAASIATPLPIATPFAAAI